jgi:hypothetical protein
MTSTRTISPERLARLEELLDRQDIHDCLKQWCRAMDRFDRELFLSAFHADAICAAGDFVGGPEALYDWASNMHDQWQSGTQHDILNHSCEIDGDVAHAETYYLYVAKNRDESLLLAGGRYIDRLERRDGAWKIALRCNVIEWACTPPAAPLPFADVADIAGNGVAARGKEDISYRRPLTNLRKPHIPG